MALVKFRIAISNGKTEERQGYRRKIAGHQCIVEYNSITHIVHHYATGMRVHFGYYGFRKTIAEAEQLLKSNPGVIDIAINELEKNGHKYPLNK